MESRNKKGTGYNYSKQWFDFTFQTQDIITPIHTALYFWIVEHNNRLHWKEVIGLPTAYSMEAVRLKSYRSYKKALDDLIGWGFIRLVSKSHNQHTCNQVALILKTKAKSEADENAFDLEAKAEPKQRQKQSRHNKTVKTIQTFKTLESRLANFKDEIFTDDNKKRYSQEMLEAYFNYWTEPTRDKTKMRFELEKTWENGRRLSTWFRRDQERKQWKQPKNTKYHASDY